MDVRRISSATVWVWGVVSCLCVTVMLARAGRWAIGPVSMDLLSYVAMAVVVSLGVLVVGVVTSKRFSKVFGLCVVLFTEWMGSGRLCTNSPDCT